jgi:hypothetical protein
MHRYQYTYITNTTLVHNHICPVTDIHIFSTLIQHMQQKQEQTILHNSGEEKKTFQLQHASLCHCDIQ